MLDGPDRPKGETRVTTGNLRATAFVLPDTYNEEHRYGTPDEAALAEPRRLDETPRLVSVEVINEYNAEVEVDKGRHPADRVLYRCVRHADGWRVEGSQTWFNEKPVNVEAAMPSDDLGVYIVESPIGGYELVITGYDFRSTHMGHYSTVEDAKAHAGGRGLPALDWQPWSPPDPDS